MEHIYSSMDIGTDTVKLVVCHYKSNKLNVLASKEVKSSGLKHGLIIDPKAIALSIKQALEETEKALGIKINKLLTGVPSYQIEYKPIKADIEIEEVITKENVKSVYKKAIKGRIPVNDEFINVVPIDFSIDDKTVVKTPIGFSGKKLSVRAMMVTAPKKNIYSVAGVLESLGIEIIDISVTGISDMYVYKNNNILSSMGAIINIGSSTTTITLYNKGIPLNTKVINVGGDDIDKDIDYMFKIPLEESKKIKETFALASKKTSSIEDIYKTIDKAGQSTLINQLDVSAIVEARLHEIFISAQNEINDLTNREIKYIIITGGVSNCLNIETVAEHVFGNLAYIGKINTIGARDNKYSVALGNILYFIDTLKIKGQEYTMLNKDEVKELSSPNKTSNDTIFGKAVGYFFGE